MRWTLTPRAALLAGLTLLAAVPASAGQPCADASASYVIDDTLDLYDHPGGKVVKTLPQQDFGPGRAVVACEGDQWVQLDWGADGPLKQPWVKRDQVKIEAALSAKTRPMRAFNSTKGDAGVAGAR